MQIIKVNEDIVRQDGSGGKLPVILWAASSRQEEEGPEKLLAQLRQLPGGDRPFLLGIFRAEDWDRDFSPWPMDLGEGRHFSGGGPEVLRWLRETAVPGLEEEYPDHGSLYLAGYSLAGLFALWAFYESGIFRGAACCSGSLWFTGWDAWADAAQVPEGSLLYLSLGGKEPNSPDPVMATIGTQYRRQELRCRKDPRFAASIYEMNSGGHFADSNKRLAKGLAWLLREDARIGQKGDR